ncbi:ABC-three component system middle component 7 [Caloramator sp. Dgby_cultured_2]
MADFLSALDCLFALGRIKLIEEKRVLRYVKRDTMR